MKLRSGNESVTGFTANNFTNIMSSCTRCNCNTYSYPDSISCSYCYSDDGKNPNSDKTACV